MTCYSATICAFVALNAVHRGQLQLLRCAHAALHSHVICVVTLLERVPIMPAYLLA